MRENASGEKCHEVATTRSCRNRPRLLLADYVAFTGSGDAGNRLDERHISASARIMRFMRDGTAGMLALQRHHEQRWRDAADVLEEPTTTRQFRHRADCPPAAIPRIAKQCLLGAGGLAIPPGRCGLATGER